MSEIVYRDGVEADFPAVAELYTRMDAHMRHLGMHLPKPDDPGAAWIDSYRRTLGRFSFLHIAELDGRVVAFIFYRLKQVPAYWGGVMVGEFSDIWVEPEVRRSGVAEKLCRIGLDNLRGLGVHSVEVQIMENNAASWGLVEGLGFKPETRHGRLMWENYVESADE